MEQLPDKILNFTTLKIRHDIDKICQCAYPTYEIDLKNRLVTCSQCGAYTDPFDALVCLAQKPERWNRELNRLIAQRKQIVNYKPHLLVFRRLEEQYRKTKSGQMLPICPKCNQLFKFENIAGWGNAMFYKDEI